MSEPKNKKLYEKIKNKIKADLQAKGKRWSAYASGRLVNEYKKKGGTYTGSKKSGKGISRWFKEQWIDVCHYPKIVPCGREAKSTRKYPYCRPLNRLSKSTPKTAKELTEKERKRRCSQKRKSPRKVLRKFNFCGEPSKSKYRIKKFTRDQAKKRGFTVKPSSKLTKKIDVYKDGVLIASVGGKNCNDYPTYMEMEKKGLVEKGTANKKRKNYKKRHENDRKKKYIDGKISRGWLADKLLW